MSSNSRDSAFDLEKEVAKVAEKYQTEGYGVILQPQREQLPEFARDFGADIIATRGDEHVLVQVKSDRGALEADPKAPILAGITNLQPAWRYDIIILNESDPLRRIARDTREPSDEELNEMLSHAEKLMNSGNPRAACVLGWAGLEAAMRRVASDAELYMPRKTPAELLRTLYGNGIISREDFDLLNRSFKLRTEIVHGLVPPAIDGALILAAIRATRFLLTGNRDAKSVAS